MSDYMIIECNMIEQTTEVYDDELDLVSAQEICKTLNAGKGDHQYFVVPSFLWIDD